MLILLDTANMESIRELSETYPIDGVTTNPSIITAEKGNFLEILEDIRKTIGSEKMLFVQTLGKTSCDIVREAEYLYERLGGNLYIKIPVVPEGVKAMGILKQKGFKVMGTAVFTPMQALIAARIGAEYVAPYVNRLDNIVSDGVNVVAEIVKIFNMHGLNTGVLAASFKSVQQVHLCCLAGAHAVTVSPDILTRLLYHPLTDLSVEQFQKDWEGFYGKGKKVNDLEML